MSLANKIRSALGLPLKRTAPEKELTFCGRRYYAAKLDTNSCVLWLVVEPPHLKGRTLKAGLDGVWECSRDGKVKPLVKFDTSPALYKKYLGVA